VDRWAMSALGVAVVAVGVALIVAVAVRMPI
jgi:hypothetical protein